MLLTLRPLNSVWGRWWAQKANQNKQLIHRMHTKKMPKRKKKYDQKVFGCKVAAAVEPIGRNPSQLTSRSPWTQKAAQRLGKRFSLVLSFRWRRTECYLTREISMPSCTTMNSTPLSTHSFYKISLKWRLLVTSTRRISERYWRHGRAVTTKTCRRK